MKRITGLGLILGLSVWAGTAAAAVDLGAAERKVFSQFGEDGVTEKLFELIEPTSKFAVEFGAGDGVKYSNTRNLFLNHGWSGLLIEGDPGLTAKAAETYKDMPRVQVRQAWIWPGNLEILFKEHNVPKDMDFISIDIDSNDYYVWMVLHNYRPKVVLIEFNPGYPPPQKFVVDYHPYNYYDTSDYYGASIQSLYELGKEKGYELVHGESHGANLFFVDRRYFARLGIKDNSPAKMYRLPQYGVDSGGRAPNGRGSVRYDRDAQKKLFGLLTKRYDRDLLINNVRVQKRPRYDL